MSGDASSSGGEVVARWREVGRWWDGEPYREVVRTVLPSGKVDETIRESPGVGSRLLGGGKAEFVENHTEDHDARFVKQRNQQVAQALGQIPPDLFDSSRPVERGYALLHCLSGYAFGRSSMLAAEIPALCAARGIPAALLADPFSLAGAGEFVKTARGVGVKPLVGATFELPEGGEIVLVARDRTGWRSLSRLVTECHLEEPRLYPLASWERLERHTEGLLCLTGGDGGPLARMLPGGDYRGAERLLERLVHLYGHDLTFVQIERSFLPWGLRSERLTLELAGHLRIRAVAGGQVTHADRSHLPVQDVLACIHTLCRIEEISGHKPPRHPDQPRVRDYPSRALNAERFVRSAAMTDRLYADRPELLANTLIVAELCEGDVLPGRTELPSVFGEDEPREFHEMAWAGARRRYGGEIYRHEIRRRMETELATICRLGFARHFLIAAQTVAWAEGQGIAVAGRGSVVDSVVAYCLGLSRIDALAHNLAFERFLPSDGSKRPDIDLDFEARRREEVRQHLVGRFGSEHVATVCAYAAYDTRGIIRGVGKAMGIPDESIVFLTKRLHGGVSPEALEDALGKRPELRESNIPRERFRWVFALAGRLTDIPKGIQAHPSGVVLSRVPIRDLVPVTHSAEPLVRLIQWDKYTAKRTFDKYDLLCLRALDILSYSQDRIRTHEPDFDERAIPIDDPETFRTMRAGDLVGITQSASPAMTSAHVRVRTDSLPDAALVQACIRPGVGGCVKNDLLVARRFGEPYALDHPDMEPILGRTYGVVVFQEQVDQLLARFCGYSEGEAEEIREGIYKRRRENYVAAMRTEIIARVVERYRDQPLAETIYDLVAPYQGYGFAEGHALAFAETTIRSLHTKIHHPAEFFAAALEAQPAGYYPAATLANEARNKGVRILPVCVNRSGLSYRPEDLLAEDDPRIVVPNGGVRLPLNRILGVSTGLAERIVQERDRGAFTSLGEFALRCGPADDELRILILVGAFDSLHPNRRAALWGATEALRYARTFRDRDGALPMDVPPPSPPEDVSDFLRAERSLMERRHLALDVEEHLMAYERERVASKGFMTVRDARVAPAGFRVMVVGNPLRLRFPPTKSGKRVVFFDCEDETGLLNLACFDATYQRDGKALVTEPYVAVWARVQMRQGHPAFLIARMITYKPTFAGAPVRPGPLPLATADFLHC